MSRIVVQKACVNGRLVKLVHDNEAGDWYVREPDIEDVGDCPSFDVFEDAQEYYNQAVKAWRDTPNWELQAAYDEAHGTDNGYAPWQYSREY